METEREAEQVVIVWLQYEADAAGDLCRDDEVLQETYRWSDQLLDALTAEEAGRCIVCEYGGGYMKELYVGPDAWAIWNAIEPVLRQLPVLRGSRGEVEGRKVWEK